MCRTQINNIQQRSTEKIKINKLFQHWWLQCQCTNLHNKSKCLRWIKNTINAFVDNDIIISVSYLLNCTCYTESLTYKSVFMLALASISHWFHFIIIFVWFLYERLYKIIPLKRKMISICNIFIPYKVFEVSCGQNCICTWTLSYFSVKWDYSVCIGLMLRWLVFLPFIFIFLIWLSHSCTFVRIRRFIFADRRSTIQSHPWNRIFFFFHPVLLIRFCSGHRIVSIIVSH